VVTRGATGARLEDFPVQVPVSVQWADIDMYGHANNAVYYQWFDTAINRWLYDGGDIDPMTAPAVGVVGESACTFEAEIVFGHEVVVGLAVRALGRSSITYVLGAFDLTSGRRAAVGHWVHVYVVRGGPPTDVPAPIARMAATARADLEPIMLRKL
jgi:acyl-CoA thioester hydrolase